MLFPVTTFLLCDSDMSISRQAVPLPLAIWSCACSDTKYWKMFHNSFSIANPPSVRVMSSSNETGPKGAPEAYHTQHLEFVTITLRAPKGLLQPHLNPPRIQLPSRSPFQNHYEFRLPSAPAFESEAYHHARCLRSIPSTCFVYRHGCTAMLSYNSSLPPSIFPTKISCKLLVGVRIFEVHVSFPDTDSPPRKRGTGILPPFQGSG